MNRRRVGKRHHRAPRALAKAVIVIAVVVFPSTTKGILCGTCRAPVVVARTAKLLVLVYYYIISDSAKRCVARWQEGLGYVLSSWNAWRFGSSCCLLPLCCPIRSLRVLSFWLRWIATLAFSSIPGQCHDIWIEAAQDLTFSSLALAGGTASPHSSNSEFAILCLSRWTSHHTWWWVLNRLNSCYLKIKENKKKTEWKWR